MRLFVVGIVGFWCAGSALAAPPTRNAKEKAVPTLEEAWDAWNAGERLRAGDLARRLSKEGEESSRSVRFALLLARTAPGADEALTLWDNVLDLEPEKSVAAEAHWGRGVAAQSLEQWSTSVEEFDRVAREYRREIDRGKAYLAKGLVELDADETRDALESLALAAGHAKSPEDRTAAELALASANYRLGNLRVALRAFEKFERDHPKDERARWAAWRAILCLRLLGRESDAAERTVQLEEDEPGSLEAILAREEIRMGGKAATAAEMRPAAKGADKDAEQKDAETKSEVPKAKRDAPAPGGR